MAEPLDPLGIWRDVLNQWEQGLNRLSTEAMQSTEAARLFNQAMAMSLRLQQGITDITARYMHVLGLPTSQWRYVDHVPGGGRRTLQTSNAAFSAAIGSPLGMNSCPRYPS